jgi:membrane fusion protein (multidrug efflux system)
MDVVHERGFALGGDRWWLAMSVAEHRTGAVPRPGAAEGPVAHVPKRRRPLRQRQRLRLPLMLLAPLVLIIGGGYLYLIGGRYVSTDDAYVQAARVAISTDVAGRVAEIAVRDNQPVKAGQLLFRLISDRFAIAVEQAQAQLDAARLQIEALKATYRQRQADLAAAKDTLAYQQRELERQKRLLASGIASQSQYDQASHAADNARQAVAAAQQQIASVLASLGGDPDIPVDRHPTVMQAQAELDRADLNMSYTVVRAPEDGIVTKVEQLQVGDYVNAAAPLFSLTSTRRIWIEANFKETDLTYMRPGQEATVTLDTYPDRPLKAKVASLSPGTGSSFSLLPPENATGNWVKVVQRLPVRLSLENVGSETPLHAGLSATAEVDTGHERHLLTAIRSALAGGRTTGR